MYDKDKNGFIDKKELENVIIAILELVGENDKNNSVNAKKRVDEIFKKLDANNDGLISQEEFIKGFSNDPSFTKLMDESCK
ncbi:neurocalcin -like protein [Brachionus plicatilis]|uniref:Neurocalcin-like protein n=1 Tax=Brachionus plicatilis TaxID=10195 RepID=A0A3M7R6N3_BRAPC|nr:neurocalcin -like protein [Brachionus plicatilis]